MSDARNSSGNIRGGGARQTGGSGRTQKNAAGGGSNKGISGIPGLSSQVLDKKLLAKRNLQMLSFSKKLAIEARKVCLEEHTEEEYIELNVPMPDPESALKKMRSMTKLTDDWHDQVFRDRWLRTVLKVWNAELKAQFDAAVKAKAANAAAKEEFEKKKKMRESSGEATTRSDTSANVDANIEGTPVSIEELEAMLQDVSLSADERKKIKKKLKKRKQKASKKKNTQGDGDGSNSGDIDDNDQ
jgi:hypothetical protein